MRSVAISVLVCSTVARADEPKPIKLDEVHKLVDAIDAKLNPSDSKKKPDFAGAAAMLSAPFTYAGFKWLGDDKEAKACQAKYKSAGTIKQQVEMEAFVTCLATEPNWNQSIGEDADWKLANMAKLPKQLKAGASLKQVKGTLMVTSYVTHAKDDNNWNLYRAVQSPKGPQLDALIVGN